jgi:hypothetical protein
MTWECSSSSAWGGNLSESAAELSCGLLLPAPSAWCLQAAFDTGVSAYHEGNSFCQYDPVALGEISTSGLDGSAAKHAAFQFSDRSEKSNSHGCVDMQHGSCQSNEHTSARSPIQDASGFRESRDSDSSDSTITASSIVTVHAEWKEEILTPISRKRSPVMKIPCGLPSARQEVLASKIKLVKASVVAPKRTIVSASNADALSTGTFFRINLFMNACRPRMTKEPIRCSADTKSVDTLQGARSRDCAVKVEQEDDKVKTNDEGSALEEPRQGTTGEAGSLVVETSVRGRRRPVLNFVDLHNGLRCGLSNIIIVSPTRLNLHRVFHSTPHTCNFTPFVLFHVRKYPFPLRNKGSRTFHRVSAELAACP